MIVKKLNRKKKTKTKNKQKIKRKESFLLLFLKVGESSFQEVTTGTCLIIFLRL